MTKLNHCDGECFYENPKTCEGVVEEVHVLHPKDPYHDWGNFYYCETAKQRDLSKGFEVRKPQLEEDE